jgi:hypothetical protein
VAGARVVICSDIELHYSLFGNLTLMVNIRAIDRSCVLNCCARSRLDFLVYCAISRSPLMIFWCRSGLMRRVLAVLLPFKPVSAAAPSSSLQPTPRTQGNHNHDHQLSETPATVLKALKDHIASFLHFSSSLRHQKHVDLLLCTRRDAVSEHDFRSGFGQQVREHGARV